MTRDEFMRELAYLLQDIQEEDKEDAIQYYTDYFDEAGPEREGEVMKELGSPERISSIIRSDIAGHLEKGGEFTERGYQDERFRDPNYRVARRFDLPEKQDQGSPKGGPGKEDAGGRRTDGQASDGNWQKEKQTGAPGQTQPASNRLLKIILWTIIILVVLPILLGIGGGVLGILGGILGIFIGILVLTGVVTAVMLFGGIAMIPYGIVCLFIDPLGGVFVLGIGLIFLGVGVLLLALSVLFYGRFIPFLIRSIVDALNRLFHTRRYPS